MPEHYQLQCKLNHIVSQRRDKRPSSIIIHKIAVSVDGYLEDKYAIQKFISKSKASCMVLGQNKIYCTDL